MMELRRLHVLGILGVLGTGLLVTAVSGCGSVAASGSASAPASGAASASASASASAAAVAGGLMPMAQTGCAGVNQATAVSIRRQLHLRVPVGMNPLAKTADRQEAQVRALFGQLCAAVTHPAPAQMMHCPADFGSQWIGTFYDRSRVLATFTYTASGCERVSVSGGGKTMATMVVGRAAAAAPHLAADLAALVGAPEPGTMQPQSGVNPGGPNKPA